MSDNNPIYIVTNDDGCKWRLSAASAQKAIEYVADQIDVQDYELSAELEHQHDWQLQEAGYVRCWSTEINDETKTVTAFYSGSEDWSEEGDGKMLLVCTGCMESKPLPDDWEVDYQ